MKLPPEGLPIRAASAGILIIGNEILSGKVQDENLRFLAAGLYRLGIRVERAMVVPDDVVAIGQAVSDLSRGYDIVITTGGIGPTHDDVTMAGVARAFGLELVRHGELEAGIRRWYAEKTNDSALKMADLPQGARLIQRPGLRFPPVLVENVFVLPGIPSYLKEKFAAIGELLEVGSFSSAELRLRVGETEIARTIEDIQKEVPQVNIGSYPRVDDPACLVVLTVDSRDEQAVREAVARLRERLPEGSILA